MNNNTSHNKLKLTSPIDNFKSNINNFLNTYIFNSDYGILLTIILSLLFISLFSVISYENINLIRYSFVNNGIAIILSIICIYLIFKNMGKKTKVGDEKISILGVDLEVGYILYVLIIAGLFIMFSG